MGEAVLLKDGYVDDFVASAALTSGDIICRPDGKAGVVAGLAGFAVNDTASAQKKNDVYTVDKSTGVVFIEGAPLWWDHSADGATCVPPLTDRDFYLGTAYADATSAATTCQVKLNNRPEYIIDFHRHGGDTAVVLTAGTPTIFNRGGSMTASFSATAEAQKVDWLSKRSFLLASNWVLEAIVEIVTDADADVADLSIGVANATHASDADSITESAFFHFDLGADNNIDCESDDGTTEVAATDSTVDWAAGTPVHLVLDGRDETDVLYYINGVEVLNATADLGDISAATGPLKALFHLEKSSNDSPGVVSLDQLSVRITD